MQALPQVQLVRLQMLSDLGVRRIIGDLIYMTGSRPEGQVRFSQRCLLSVCPSLAYLIVLMIQETGLALSTSPGHIRIPKGCPYHLDELMPGFINAFVCII
jgi:hypothetical protein